MCGISGYVGSNKAGPILFDILKKLEYRGYDSAGIAVTSEFEIEVIKSLGGINELRKKYLRKGSPGEGIGIGHNRWATHGTPSEKNGHPHISRPHVSGEIPSGNIAVVHNGIIENYIELREKLISGGYDFRTDTDTEVLAHLINYHYKTDLVDAVKTAVSLLRGSYAIVVLSKDWPYLVCAKKGLPIIIGKGKAGHYVASDEYALLPHVEKLIWMEDDEIAIVDAEEIKIRTKSGDVEIGDLDSRFVFRDLNNDEFDFNLRQRPEDCNCITWEEIHEQPISVQRTFDRCISENEDVDLDIGLTNEEIESLDHVHIVASGTSYHAGLMAKYVLSRMAGLPVSVELASEFQYIKPKPDSLLIAITQSGNTKDVLDSVNKARKHEMRTLAITNVKRSCVTNIADRSIFIHSGKEIGVVATKTFMSQIMVLALLAIKLGCARGVITPEDARKMILEARDIPKMMNKFLAQRNNKRNIKSIAENYASYDHYYFIGREFFYPVALEGALKMEEMALMSAKGYPAGEFKHGPLALITDRTNKRNVVVAFAPSGGEIRSDMEMAHARGANIIAIASQGDEDIRRIATDVIEIPKTSPVFSAIFCAVAVQLLAYYTGKARGLTDEEIDKPRNLAKCVTVA
jgi:glucosamine--fructose-6-phosphate aminotransferase (isomerizing)